MTLTPAIAVRQSSSSPGFDRVRIRWPPFAPRTCHGVDWSGTRTLCNENGKPMNTSTTDVLTFQSVETKEIDRRRDPFAWHSSTDRRERKNSDFDRAMSVTHRQHSCTSAASTPSVACVQTRGVTSTVLSGRIGVYLARAEKSNFPLAVGVSIVSLKLES